MGILKKRTLYHVKGRKSHASQLFKTKARAARFSKRYKLGKPKRIKSRFRMGY